MMARMAYEYFLKELGRAYLNKEDGDKYALSSMRNLLFEKRNCTIEQNADGDILLSILDSEMTGVTHAASTMLMRMKEEGKSKSEVEQPQSCPACLQSVCRPEVSGRVTLNVSAGTGWDRLMLDTIKNSLEIIGL